MEKNIFIGVDDNNNGGVLTATFSFDTLLHRNYIEASDFTEYESNSWYGKLDLDQICNMMGIKLTGRFVDLTTPIEFKGNNYHYGIKYPWSVIITKILEVEGDDNSEESDNDTLKKLSEYMDLSNEVLVNIYPDAIRLLNNIYDESHRKGYKKGRKEGLMEADDILKDLMVFYLNTPTDKIQDLFNTLGIVNIIQEYSLKDIRDIMYKHEKNESEVPDCYKVKPGSKILDIDRNKIYIVKEIQIDTFNHPDRSILAYDNSTGTDCLIDTSSIKKLSSDLFMGKIQKAE